MRMMQLNAKNSSRRLHRFKVRLRARTVWFVNWWANRRRRMTKKINRLNLRTCTFKNCSRRWPKKEKLSRKKFRHWKTRKKQNPWLLANLQTSSWLRSCTALTSLLQTVNPINRKLQKHFLSRAPTNRSKRLTTKRLSNRHDPSQTHLKTSL